MLTPAEIARARAETPGCEQVLHFNNAGAGLMPAAVVEAVKAHYELEAAIGGYEAADREEARWLRAYHALAALLNCRHDEIAVVENATRAWDMAAYAVPLAPGDRVLTAEAEYVSNYLALLQLQRRTRCSVEVVPSDESGQVDVAALARLLDRRVKLVCLTHAPGSGGLVHPVAEVGRVLKGSGILYLVDACQSAGQLPLDVEAIGCDLLSATGRKFLRGPRATGFLYVRRAVLERLDPPFVDLHAAEWTARESYAWRPDARRFENWETNIATKVGLAVAVDHALGWGIERISARTLGLAESLRRRLAGIPGVVVRDRGVLRSGIVTFTVDGRDPRDLRRRWRERGINVTVSEGNIARLDYAARGLERAVRASPHYYNTEDEIERFAAAVAEPG